MKPESSVIFFPCTDLDETVRYYRDVLALPVYKLLPATVWFDCGSGTSYAFLLNSFRVPI